MNQVSFFGRRLSRFIRAKIIFLFFSSNLSKNEGNVLLHKFIYYNEVWDQSTFIIFSCSKQDFIPYFLNNLEASFSRIAWTYYESSSASSVSKEIHILYFWKGKVSIYSSDSSAWRSTLTPSRLSFSFLSCPAWKKARFQILCFCTKIEGSTNVWSPTRSISEAGLGCRTGYAWWWMHRGCSSTCYSTWLALCVFWECHTWTAINSKEQFLLCCLKIWLFFMKRVPDKCMK